VAEIEQEKRFR